MPRCLGLFSLPTSPKFITDRGSLKHKKSHCWGCRSKHSQGTQDNCWTRSGAAVLMKISITLCRATYADADRTAQIYTFFLNCIVWRQIRVESFVSRDILDKTMGSNVPVLRHLAEEAAQQKSRHAALVYGKGDPPLLVF